MICRFTFGSIFRRSLATGGLGATLGSPGRLLRGASIVGCCGGAVGNSSVCPGASIVGPDETAVDVGVGNGSGDQRGVGVGLGLGNLNGVGVEVAVGLDIGIGVGLGDGKVLGANVGIGDANGVGVGLGVGKIIGVGVGLGSFSLAVGIGLGSSKASVGLGEGEGIGDRVSSFSASSISSFGVGDAFARSGLALAVGVDPGSDQPPAFSPFTKFACNLVFPCSRITGPSNFPRTIFPV